MAIRRGILVGIGSVDELFEGQLQNMGIKDEYKDKPVFLASMSEGTSIDLDEPMKAASLTSYLKLCGQQNGFPDGKSKLIILHVL